MESRGYRQLLTQREYVKVVVADVVSRFGDSIDAIAYSWIMYEVTGSASLMALILGLNYLPTVFLQPLAGALVDRLRKKWLMVGTDVIRCAMVVLAFGLYGSGTLTPVAMAVLALATSTVEALRNPAAGALMPTLLERDLFTLGKAAHYSLCNSSQLAGLMLAGAIIGLAGPGNALLVDAATFAVSAAVLACLRHREEHGATAPGARQVLTDFREGLAFVRRSKTVQVVGLLGLLINFGLMPLSVFQTPYVYDYLHMGPEVLSYIKVLMMVGMIGGSALTPKLPAQRNGRVAAIAGVLMGVAIASMWAAIAVGVLPARMALLTAGMLLVGAGGGVLNVIVGSSLMRVVPSDMMGRVSGLNAAVMQASMPVGSFVCSALALVMDVPAIVLAFGLVTVVMYGAFGRGGVLAHLDAR